MSVYIIANGPRVGQLLADGCGDKESGFPPLTSLEAGETTVEADGGIVYIKDYPELYKLYKHAFTRHGKIIYTGNRLTRFIQRWLYRLGIINEMSDDAKYVSESGRLLISFGLPDYYGDRKKNANRFAKNDDLVAMLIAARQQSK